jgi:hypothetical protein
MIGGAIAANVAVIFAHLQFLDLQRIVLSADKARRPSTFNKQM